MAVIHTNVGNFLAHSFQLDMFIGCEKAKNQCRLHIDNIVYRVDRFREPTNMEICIIQIY